MNNTPETASEIYGSFSFSFPSFRLTDSYLLRTAASKAHAEKAAWAFVKQPGVKFTLSTFIFVFSPSFRSSSLTLYLYSIAPVFTLGYHSAPGIKALKDFKATPEIALEVLWTKNAFTPADGVAFNPVCFCSFSLLLLPPD